MSLLLAGSILGAGALASAGAIYTNQQNLKNTNKWNDVQVDLANTAHQREVLDLRSAGLNPVLSASGSGASVPALGSANMTNPAEGIADGISSAADLYTPQYKAQVANLKANTENINEDTSAKKVQQSLVNQQRENEKIRSEILEGDRGSSLWKNHNAKLDAMARSEAVTGKIASGLEHYIDWEDKNAVRTYNDLVEKYRNEIELDRYLNSVERQMLLDGVNTAGSLKNLKSTRNVIHNLKGKSK